MEQLKFQRFKQVVFDKAGTIHTFVWPLLCNQMLWRWSVLYWALDAKLFPERPLAQAVLYFGWKRKRFGAPTWQNFSVKGEGKEGFQIQVKLQQLLP